MAETALITGITGHDGIYLAEFLLKIRLYPTWYKKNYGEYNYN